MYQRGVVNPWAVVTVVLGVLIVGLGVFSAWAFASYLDYKDNVDAKVTDASAVAKSEQSKADEALFSEREKLPTKQSVGPADLGKVTFDFPKTWSLYVNKDGSGGAYQAYLHPGSVLPVDGKSGLNAVVVSVDAEKYEESLDAFKDAVAKGELKATPITINDQTGTRLDGNFGKNVQGSAVLFKVRDKTLKLMVNSNDFLGDFNNTILTSLRFNP